LILRSYGIPDKIIGIIQNFYKGSRCAVRADGQRGEWFQIVTGVRQGCLLSPLIFLLVADWILKRSISNNECGLPWNEGQKLTVLDFADDIAVLE
jgi:Reverse transcriptase (RNA-dependent DNA polymerase)